MTVFDLLFIALLVGALGTLVFAAAVAARGKPAQALAVLRRLGLFSAFYLGMVYLFTAFSSPRILRIGDPQCFDDWCLAVETANPVTRDALTHYDITLRVFSRARRVAQRENGANDVYLVDGAWNRYDPGPHPAEIPLNILLQPGESITTRRTFQLPANARTISLMLDHGSGPLGICLVIGECSAFHKGTRVSMD